MLHDREVSKDSSIPNNSQNSNFLSANTQHKYNISKAILVLILHPKQPLTKYSKVPKGSTFADTFH